MKTYIIMQTVLLLHLMLPGKIVIQGMIKIKKQKIKSKRLLKIRSEIDKNSNIDQVISSFKPPIFWKEKEIVKQQINIWSFNKIQDLLVKVNKLELMVKKNPTISTNLVTNFILEQAENSNNQI